MSHVDTCNARRQWMITGPHDSLYHKSVDLENLDQPSIVEDGLVGPRDLWPSASAVQRKRVSDATC